MATLRSKQLIPNFYGTEHEMSRLECIAVDDGVAEASVVLLDPRPFRPFKSSEEYLYAMKEDLAEWLQRLYPHLDIDVDNFMQRLDDGVALCKVRHFCVKIHLELCRWEKGSSDLS
jgi:hypothetical protein